MNYLMITKFDSVFTKKGEFETYYDTKYIRDGINPNNIKDNTKTIFINTKHHKIFEGVLLKIKSYTNQNIKFIVKLDKELKYLNHYDSRPSSWYVIDDIELSQFINTDSEKEVQDVYITLANSARLKYYLNPDKIKELKGEIYKTRIDFFNKYEVGSLLAIQEFFKNPENFINELYKPVKFKDTFKFVWEGGYPAFHKSLNCEKLNKEYENFEIPQEIIDKGMNEIVKFRKWFNENIHLLEKPDIFVMNLHLAFGIITNPANITLPNSGSTIIKNYELSELEKKIDEILFNVNKYSKKDNKTNTILLKYAQISFIYKKRNPIPDNNTMYSDEEIFEVLNEFENEYKKPLYKLLIEYYKVKLNPELKFSNKLLEQIGFKSCASCFH